GRDQRGVVGETEKVPRAGLVAVEVAEVHATEDASTGRQRPVPPLLVPHGHLLTTYLNRLQPESAPSSTRSLRRVSSSSASGSEPGIIPFPPYSRAPPP